MRALSEAARKQLASYKEAESDQTKGLFFLSEADLKASHPDPNPNPNLKASHPDPDPNPYPNPT